MLDTHYYGGIKKYQWTALPLALHGVVAKKDGSLIPVSIGDRPEDPVFGVSDLLPHLASKQMEKKAREFVEGENLNVLVGSRPLEGDQKEAVKASILQILKEQYNIEMRDFISAEIEVVPAGGARDYGLDRSMIMSYGQDDRGLRLHLFPGHGGDGSSGIHQRLPADRQGRDRQRRGHRHAFPVL